MIFRQPVSSTSTYLLGCEETHQAVLVDPVMPTWRSSSDDTRRHSGFRASCISADINVEYLIQRTVSD
jgi:hypothetical protein